MSEPRVGPERLREFLDDNEVAFSHVPKHAVPIGVLLALDLRDARAERDEAVARALKDAERACWKVASVAVPFNERGDSFKAAAHRCAAAVRLLSDPSNSLSYATPTSGSTAVEEASNAEPGSTTPSETQK